MGKASTYQRRARDFAQKADWDAALAELRQAIAADPGNPMLQNQMGDLFLRKEEIGQACQHFEKAIELYASLGLHNNAVALCRKVIRLCPSRLEVRYQLACLRHEQGLHSEASGFFADYFDHLPVDGEAAIRTLEERSTEVVESYLESAPVGRILEKLEDARSFPQAFALVQGLAQRAADAGDDEAARRYTTKMRSLRVLVESHGGDLPQAPRPAAKKAAVDAVSAPGDAASALGDASGSARREPAAQQAQGWMEPSALLEPAEIEVPEPVLRESGPSTLRNDAAETAGLEDEPGVTDLGPPFATEDPSPVLEQPLAAAPQAADADAIVPQADGEPPGQEYEIPETSLEDIAGLWSGDAESAANAAVEATADEVFAGAAPETVDPLPELVLEPPDALTTEGSPAADARPVLPNPEAAGPPHGSERAADGSFRLGAREADGLAEVPPMRPDTWENGAAWQESAADEGQTVEEITLPDTTPRWDRRAASPFEAPEDAAVSEAAEASRLHDPVWVPEGEWGTTNQEPWPEAGSIHELSEVIETFRSQMAQALGDDAAARYDLGVAYYEMGLYNEALSEFEAARPHAALRECSLEMMAACMAMQGRHAEILDLLGPALQTPSQPERVLGLRYSMGVACEALGRRDEARRHFEFVARIDSGYRDVSARLQLH